jgi:glucosamine-6-phosphate deaminase
MYHLYRSLLKDAQRPHGPIGLERDGLVQFIQQPDQLGMVTEHVSAGVRLMTKKNADAVGHEAATLVAEQLAKKPDSSIVFPTGKTPLPLYKALRELGHLNWFHSRLFQLDEYLPPQPGQPTGYETFAEFMQRELWAHVDGQKYYLKDFLGNPQGYEHLVKQNNGPDLVLLGIGANGHVAFNEPGSQPDSATRVIDLTAETLRSNFGGLHQAEYPRQAVTMGLKTILGAKKILLMATGEGKRDILQRAFNPTTPPSLDCPASWLKRHPNVLILTDFKVSFPVD